MEIYGKHKYANDMWKTWVRDPGCGGPSWPARTHPPGYSPMRLRVQPPGPAGPSGQGGVSARGQRAWAAAGAGPGVARGRQPPCPELGVAAWRTGAWPGRGQGMSGAGCAWRGTWTWPGARGCGRGLGGGRGRAGAGRAAT